MLLILTVFLAGEQASTVPDRPLLEGANIGLWIWRPGNRCWPTGDEREGASSLMPSKIELGAGASAAAGSVARILSTETDVLVAGFTGRRTILRSWHS